MSEINPKELETRIRKWLETNYKLNITVTHNEKNHFFIFIKHSEKPDSIPAIQIIYSKERSDRINIGWKYGFTEDEIAMFKNIDKKILTKIQNEIVNGFLLMNLSFKLEPSVHDIQIITCNSYIYLDGISQDRFKETLSKLYNAFRFINRTYDEYLDFRDTFIPDELI